MVFIKSFGVGLAAFVAYAIIVFGYPFIAVAAYPIFKKWSDIRGTGSGGIGAVSFGVGPLHLLVGLVIFALAFWWEWRRAG
jgi:hypothetical protein